MLLSKKKKINKIIHWIFILSTYIYKNVQKTTYILLYTEYVKNYDLKFKMAIENYYCTITWLCKNLFCFEITII